MNVENGTPWKSTSVAVALPIFVMQTGNGANCRKKSNVAVTACTCLIVSVVSCLGAWRCFTRSLPSCVLHKTLRSAHLDRQSVRISSMGRSRESWRKKYWSWRSDRDSQPVGMVKLKNASILRKYGSICMGERQEFILQIEEYSSLYIENSPYHLNTFLLFLFSYQAL